MGCCNQNATPARVLMNAVTAGGRVARSAVLGKRIKAEPETIEARRALCLACEFCKPWEKDSSFHKCTKCGCWLDGKYFSKLAIATERCPVGKWEAQ